MGKDAAMVGGLAGGTAAERVRGQQIVSFRCRQVGKKGGGGDHHDVEMKRPG